MSAFGIPTAAALAEKLLALGLPVLASCEPAMEHDGMVELTNQVHVQFGDYYMNGVVEAGEEDDPCWEFYDEATSFEALVADIRIALVCAEVAP